MQFVIRIFHVPGRAAFRASQTGYFYGGLISRGAVARKGRPARVGGLLPDVT